MPALAPYQEISPSFSASHLIWSGSVNPRTSTIWKEAGPAHDLGTEEILVDLPAPVGVEESPNVEESFDQRLPACLRALFRASLQSFKSVLGRGARVSLLQCASITSKIFESWSGIRQRIFREERGIAGAGFRSHVIHKADECTGDHLVKTNIPQYILDYAPFIHLFSKEQFWPSEITEHLRHVSPYLNYSALETTAHNLNLTNLDQLNEWNGGRFIYLQSDDDVETRPDWLSSRENIPYDPDKAIEPHDLRRRGSRSRLRLDGLAHPRIEFRSTCICRASDLLCRQ